MYTGPVIPIAEAFNLTLIAANSTVINKPAHPLGSVTLGVTGEKGLPVAPITPLGEGPAWEIFGWASRRAFGKEGDKGEVIVAPSASTGNTDTKHYVSNFP